MTRPTVVVTIQQTMRTLGSWIVVLDNQDFGRFELEMIDWKMRYTKDNADWHVSECFCSIGGGGEGRTQRMDTVTLAPMLLSTAPRM